MHDLSVCAISVEQASVTLEADPGWARLRCSVRVDLPTDFPRVQGTAQVRLLTRDGEIVGAVSGTGMLEGAAPPPINFGEFELVFPVVPEKTDVSVGVQLVLELVETGQRAAVAYPMPIPGERACMELPTQSVTVSSPMTLLLIGETLDDDGDYRIEISCFGRAGLVGGTDSEFRFQALSADGLVLQSDECQLDAGDNGLAEAVVQVVVNEEKASGGTLRVEVLERCSLGRLECLVKPLRIYPRPVPGEEDDRVAGRENRRATRSLQKKVWRPGVGVD